MQQPVKEATLFPDKTFPLNIFFLPIYENVPFIHLHWHPHIEWIYMLSGKARIQMDTTFTDVNQGDLVFVNANQVHGATLLQENTQAVAIVINESLIRNSFLDSTEAQYILPIFDRTITMPNLTNPNNPITIQIRSMIEELIQEFINKKVGYELFIKSKLYAILGLMFRHFHRDVESENKPRKENTELNQAFRFLLQHLEKNYQQNISINDASRMINMSPSHFYRVFKKITGKTFVEYLNTLRIYNAQYFLTDPCLTIAEVSERAGFGSVAYFGRVFKEIKNVTPSEYRKLAHEEAGASVS